MESNLIKPLISFGLTRDWDKKVAKWGRKGVSTLLAHSLTVVGITNTLMDVIGDFDESDRRVAIATSFFHDMLKEDRSSKEKIKESGRLMDKLYTDEDYNKIKNVLQEIDFSEDEIKQVIGILPDGSMQGIEHLEGLLSKKDTKDNPEVRRLVHEVADVLASKKSIDEFNDLGVLEDTLDHFNLDLKFHKVSVIRGVLTSLLHKTFHQIYEKARYVPVVFYPEGTVYIGLKNTRGPDFTDFKNLYWQNLKDYLEDVSKVRSLGQESIGRVNATAVESPSFAYLNENTLNAFWDAARNQNAINNSNIKGYDKIIDKDQFDSDEVMEDWFREKVGLYYLFIYFKSVLEHCTHDWKDEESIEILEKLLKDELESTELTKGEFLEEIKSLSHTKPKEVKIETGKKLKNMFPDGLSRNEILDQATDFCKRVTIDLRPYAEKHYGLMSTNIAEQMLEEVSYPQVVNVQTIVEEVWDEYKAGKIKGTPLCVLCGRKATNDAKAGLLGKSQTFTNFLKGGSRIAVGNKLGVCDLCEIEMTIRTLYTRNAEFEEYYIVPQINLSPDYAEFWTEVMDGLLKGYNRYGIEPITRDRTWANMVIDNKGNISKVSPDILNNYTSYLLENLWKNEQRDLKNNVKDAIMSVVDTDYNGDLQKFIGNLELSCEGVDELVELAIQGNENILWHIEHELTESNKPKIRTLFAMITPNYVLISYPLRRNEKKDHKSANYLRHLFRSSILSKLFMASVIVKELRYEPLLEVTAKGAVKIPTNIQFDDAFSNFGIELKDGWLGYEDLDTILFKLSALFCLDGELKRISPLGKSQKGSLITILNEYPGRTLNRMQQLSSDKNRPNISFALDMLNIVFEEGGKK